MFRYFSRMAALCGLLLMAGAASAQKFPPKYTTPKPAAARHWADSVYNRLSEDERIGQLFMVAAYSGGKNFNQEAIEKLIAYHQIGGLIFMQGGPVRQAVLTNRYQGMAQVPLMMAMDAEWGLGMRLDSVINLPRQMMLGATHDTDLAYALGMAVAYQCRRIGVQVDFAPVVDVNNNPNNPVINARSFGEDKVWVARMAAAYMRGMQDYGVMACAKHFPGHGDTDVDSHQDLPVVKKTMEQLDTLELYPFRHLIAEGVQSMMVAHLSIPALETEEHVPTTLSRNTVTTLLKEQLGFKGLVFTDALNMQGVAKYFAPGDVDVRAFLAGNDVLLFSQDVPTAIAKIKEALGSGKASRSDLEQRVKKILRAKYNAGLAAFRPIDTTNITADLNKYTAGLNSRVADSALTLVRDTKGLLPLKRPGRILYIAVNKPVPPAVLTAMKAAYGNSFDTMSILKGQSIGQLETGMKSYDATIVGVHGLSFYPGVNYGLDDAQLRLLTDLAGREATVVALMGNAYAIKYVCNAGTLLTAYEDNEWTQRSVVRALIGELKAAGTLPVTPPCLR